MRVPDVVPADILGGRGGFSLVAGDFEEVYGPSHWYDDDEGANGHSASGRRRRGRSAGPEDDDEEESSGRVNQRGRWGAVVTCFFIDTARNVLNYLRIIHGLLDNGGVWINLGEWWWRTSSRLVYITFLALILFFLSPNLPHIQRLPPSLFPLSSSLTVRPSVHNVIVLSHVRPHQSRLSLRSETRPGSSLVGGRLSCSVEPAAICHPQLIPTLLPPLRCLACREALTPGPLLWHFENSSTSPKGEGSIELSLDEVKALARMVGFELSVSLTFHATQHAPPPRVDTRTNAPSRRRILACQTRCSNMCIM